MRRNRSLLALAGEYISLGLLLPAATVVGYGIGYMLDNALGTSFLKPVFLVFGIVAGFVQLIRKVQKDTRGPEQ